MAKFRVRLAQLVRETAVVVVEADSREELEERISEVFDMEDGSADWQCDEWWGVEEGTHEILGLAEESAEADYDLTESDEDE